MIGKLEVQATFLNQAPLSRQQARAQALSTHPTAPAVPQQQQQRVLLQHRQPQPQPAERRKDLFRHPKQLRRRTALLIKY